eukprot:g5431.t1
MSTELLPLADYENNIFKICKFADMDQLRRLFGIKNDTAEPPDSPKAKDGEDSDHGENEEVEEEQGEEEEEEEEEADDPGSNYDLNAKDDFGNTPLCYAASAGFNEGIDILLGKGASIDVTGSLGRTALHFAADTMQEDSIV